MAFALGSPHLRTGGYNNNSVRAGDGPALGPFRAETVIRLFREHGVGVGLTALALAMSLLPGPLTGGGLLLVLLAVLAATWHGGRAAGWSALALAAVSLVLLRIAFPPASGSGSGEILGLG